MGRALGDLYGVEAVGLRYFNVFGPRQDLAGPYAAVIPAWTRALLRGGPCVVHGDGGTTRDFVLVGDVVQANLLAAVADLPEGKRVFNVGAGRSTALNELFALLRDAAAELRPDARFAAALHDAARKGDARGSRADLSRIAAALGYRPTDDFRPALRQTLRWHHEAEADRQTPTALLPHHAIPAPLDPPYCVLPSKKTGAAVLRQTALPSPSPRDPGRRQNLERISDRI